MFSVLFILCGRTAILITKGTKSVEGSARCAEPSVSVQNLHVTFNTSFWSFGHFAEAISHASENGDEPSLESGGRQYGEAV
jgi:hypothetical protein